MADPSRSSPSDVRPRRDPVAVVGPLSLAVAALTLGGVIAVRGLVGYAEAQIAVQNQGYVPFSDAPIRYRDPVRDPVASAQKALDAGKAKLVYDKERGYLPAVLKLLA